MMRLFTLLVTLYISNYCIAFQSTVKSNINILNYGVNYNNLCKSQRLNALRPSSHLLSSNNDDLTLSMTSDKPDNKSTSDLQPYQLSLPQFVYMVMTTTFVTCLLIAQIVGVKIFEWKLPFPILGFTKIEPTCGMLTFPLTFIISDTITEYYGPKATQATVYLGLCMSIIVLFVVNIAQALPYLDKPFNVTPAAFNMVFGSAKVLYLASLAAYLVGQFTDIWLFELIKKWTKGKWLWLRASLSTVISQIFDSFLVSYIAFRLGKQLTNQVPATVLEVINISLTGYFVKFIVSIATLPLMYVLKVLFQDKFKIKPM